MSSMGPPTLECLPPLCHDLIVDHLAEPDKHATCPVRTRHDMKHDALAVCRTSKSLQHAIGLPLLKRLPAPLACGYDGALDQASAPPGALDETLTRCGCRQLCTERFARALGPPAAQALRDIDEGDPTRSKSWCVRRTELVRRLYQMFGGLSGLEAARDAHVAESLRRLQKIRGVLDDWGFRGWVDDALTEYAQGASALSLQDAASATVDQCYATRGRHPAIISGDTGCYAATAVLEDARGEESGRRCALCTAEAYGKCAVGMQGVFLRECPRRASDEAEAMLRVMGDVSLVVGVCTDCWHSEPHVENLIIEFGCGCQMETECTFDL